MNIKLVIIIILIVIIFLLNKNIKTEQENYQNPINARYIRIEGGKNFTLSEIKIFDINGNNILTPLDGLNIINNDYNFTYKNKDNQDIIITLEKGGFFNKKIYPLTQLVDGVIDGEDRKQRNNFFYGDNKLVHSILIDLGKEYIIKQIKLYPRWNKLPQRLHTLDKTRVSLLNKIDSEYILQETNQIDEYKLNSKNELEPIVF